MPTAEEVDRLLQGTATALSDRIVKAVDESFDRGIDRLVSSLTGVVRSGKVSPEAKSARGPRGPYKKRAAAAITASVADTVTPALTSALDGAAEALTQFPDSVDSGMRTGVGAAVRNLFGYFRKAARPEIESSFDEVRDQIKEKQSEIFDQLQSHWGDLLATLPAIGIMGIAAEAQHDMKSTIMSQTGFVTEQFNDFNSLVSKSTALLGLEQDQALAVAGAFYERGLASKKTNEEIFGLTQSTSQLVHLFDMAGDEASQVVLHLLRMGLTKKKIDELTKSTFELGSTMGLPQEAMKESITTAADLVEVMAFAGPDATRKMTESLMRLKVGYRQVNLGADDAIEALRNVISGSEEGRIIVQRLAQQTGMSFGELVNMAETSADQFIGLRNRIASEDLMSRMGLTASDLINVDPTELKKRFSFVQKIAGPQLQELYGISEAELTAMTRVFTSSTGAQRAEIEKLIAEGRTAGQIFEALLVPKQGPGRTMDQALQDFHSLLATSLEHLTNLGHALIMMIGMPLLQVVGPALGAFTHILQEAYRIGVEIPGLFEAISWAVGVFSAILLTRGLVAIGRMVGGLVLWSAKLAWTTVQVVLNNKILKMSWISTVLAAGKAAVLFAGRVAMVGAVMLSSGVKSVAASIAQIGIWATTSAIAGKGVMLLSGGMRILGVAVRFMLGPIGLIIAAVTAGIALWKNWGAVTEWVGEKWIWLKEMGGEFLDYLLTLPLKMVQGFLNVGKELTDAILGPFQNAWDSLKGWFVGESPSLVGEGIVVGVQSVQKPVENALAAPFENRAQEISDLQRKMGATAAVTSAATTTSTAGSPTMWMKGVEDKLDLLISALTQDTELAEQFRALLKRKMAGGKNAALHDMVRAGAL